MDKIIEQLTTFATDHGLKISRRCGRCCQGSPRVQRRDRHARQRVLGEPEPHVAVAELADSSVNLVVRPWVKKEDYWAVRFDVTRKIKEAFDDNGIEIPFPQRVVHMASHSGD